MWKRPSINCGIVFLKLPNPWSEGHLLRPSYLPVFKVLIQDTSGGDRQLQLSLVLSRCVNVLHIVDTVVTVAYYGKLLYFDSVNVLRTVDTVVTVAYYGKLLCFDSVNVLRTAHCIQCILCPVVRQCERLRTVDTVVTVAYYGKLLCFDSVNVLRTVDTVVTVAYYGKLLYFDSVNVLRTVTLVNELRTVDTVVTVAYYGKLLYFDSVNVLRTVDTVVTVAYYGKLLYFDSVNVLRTVDTVVTVAYYGNLLFFDSVNVLRTVDTVVTVAYYGNLLCFDSVNVLRTVDTVVTVAYYGKLLYFDSVNVLRTVDTCERTSHCRHCSNSGILRQTLCFDSVNVLRTVDTVVTVAYYGKLLCFDSVVNVLRTVDTVETVAYYGKLLCFDSVNVLRTVDTVVTVAYYGKLLCFDMVNVLRTVDTVVTVAYYGKLLCFDSVNVLRTVDTVVTVAYYGKLLCFDSVVNVLRTVDTVVTVAYYGKLLCFDSVNELRTVDTVVKVAYYGKLLCFDSVNVLRTVDTVVTVAYYGKLLCFDSVNHVDTRLVQRAADNQSENEYAAYAISYYVGPRIGFESRRGRSRISARGSRAGRCRRSAGFLSDFPLPRPLIPAFLHTHLVSPSSALKTLMLRLFCLVQNLRRARKTGRVPAAAELAASRTRAGRGQVYVRLGAAEVVEPRRVAGKQSECVTPPGTVRRAMPYRAFLLYSLRAYCPPRVVLLPRSPTFTRPPPVQYSRVQYDCQNSHVVNSEKSKNQGRNTVREGSPQPNCIDVPRELDDAFAAKYIVDFEQRSLAEVWGNWRKPRHEHSWTAASSRVPSRTELQGDSRRESNQTAVMARCE
ncbi:hypothetical protein PR048_030900 [Dryococelus australis]|uniref:Uncharacterized protein n=1 Tax=Dryococelus australis TaxID=614101 RepID=A0ABQ9GA83_9NEOP|nr:hypothetical protein PR048_030900 [Dryococelus australis]